MLQRLVLFLALACSLNAASAPEVYLFKRLAVSTSDAATLALAVDVNSPATLYTQGVPLLQTPAFKPVLDRYLGKPISADLVTALKDDIVKFVRDQDRLLAHISIPNQNVSDGTVRITAEVVGQLNQVAFTTSKWFSPKLIEQRLGLKPGDEVRLSALEDAVTWANTNPFRQVKVILNPLAGQPGKADLIVGLQEVMPWRFALVVDNYGNALLGKQRYTGSVQFGNLWGLDHQGSYQLVTTDEPDVYQGHVLSYRIPTEQRHFISINTAYSRVKPTWGPSNEYTQTGINKSIDVRYSIPFRHGANPVEVWAGMSFKRGNNNFEYGGAQQLYQQYRSTDTIQISTGGSYVRRDKRGAWALGGTLNISPGSITGRNDHTTYEETRAGSSPRYLYGTISLQRQHLLNGGWELSARLIAQKSSTNLIGSEQLAIGGPMTVRGYSTNVFAGDEGYMFNVDMLSPTITKSLERLSKKLPPLETRLVLFYDAAQVFYRRQQSFEITMKPLATVGTGIRMSMPNNFGLWFDYGWQLTEPHTLFRNHPKRYGHIKVSLAF